MRKVKIIQVEGRGEVTVKEISPHGLWQAYQNEGGRLEQLTALFDDAVTPGFAELSTWYPSEIEHVVDGFLAVNDSFFGIARKLKVDGLIKEMAKKLTSSLPPLFADLFSQVTATLGTTGGQSS